MCRTRRRRRGSGTAADRGRGRLVEHMLTGLLLLCHCCSPVRQVMRGMYTGGGRCLCCLLDSTTGSGGDGLFTLRRRLEIDVGVVVARRRRRVTRMGGRRPTAVADH
jgi:hypothetical protein